MGAISGFKQYINQHFGFNKFKFTKRSGANLTCATENNPTAELNLVAGEFMEFRPDNENTPNKIIIRSTPVVWFEQRDDGKYYDGDGAELTEKRLNDEYNKRTIYLKLKEEKAYVWRDNKFVRIIDYAKYNDIYQEFTDILWFHHFEDYTDEEGKIHKEYYAKDKNGTIVIRKDDDGVNKKILVNTVTGESYKLQGNGTTGEWRECAAFRTVDSLQEIQYVYFNNDYTKAYFDAARTNEVVGKYRHQNVLYCDYDSSFMDSPLIFTWHGSYGRYLLWHGIWPISRMSPDYKTAYFQIPGESTARVLPGSGQSLYVLNKSGIYYAYDFHNNIYVPINEPETIVEHYNNKTLTISLI